MNLNSKDKQITLNITSKNKGLYPNPKVYIDVKNNIFSIKYVKIIAVECTINEAIKKGYLNELK